MNKSSRRSVVKSAAWMVPAITIVTAAPAYAVSNPTPACFPEGCKAPGEGPNTKDYFVRANCSGSFPRIVYIRPTINESWAPMIICKDGWWVIRGLSDSQTPMQVRIEDGNDVLFEGVVHFEPCKGGAPC